MRRRALAQDVVSTLVELLGVGVTSYGLYRVYQPLGWLLGGVFLIVMGFSLSPKTGERR